jgi:hypothetical protein
MGHRRDWDPPTQKEALSSSHIRLRQYEYAYFEFFCRLRRRISASRVGLSGLQGDVFLTVGPGIAQGKKYTSRSRVQKIGK